MDAKVGKYHRPIRQNTRHLLKAVMRCMYKPNNTHNACLRTTNCPLHRSRRNRPSRYHISPRYREGGYSFQEAHCSYAYRIYLVGPDKKRHRGMGIVRVSCIGGSQESPQVHGQHTSQGRSRQGTPIFTEEHVKLIIGPFVSMYYMTLVGKDGRKVSGTHQDKHTLRSILIKKYQTTS